MPIYEYRCDNCGHELETIQKVSEEPLKRCPACEQDTLRKRVSAAAFRLKGGGWYETDFKSDKKRNVAGERSDGGKDSGDGGKESKSADKSASEGSGSSKSSENTGSKSADSGKSGDSGKSSSEGKGTSGTSKSRNSD